MLQWHKKTNDYHNAPQFENKCFRALGRRGAQQGTGVPMGDPRRCFRCPALDKYDFDTPYIAYDEIRKGWETTWFQICQPLKDWERRDVRRLPCARPLFKSETENRKETCAEGCGEEGINLKQEMVVQQ